MSIKLRLGLLLGLLLLAFTISLRVLQGLERRQAEQLAANRQQDRERLLDRWMEVTGASLRQFADDYSYWDEMVAYIERPNDAWAANNFSQIFDTFDLSALWVLRADFSPVSSHHPDSGEVPLPIPASDLPALFGRNRFPHFFVDSPLGLIEIRGAPVHPTADITRTGPSEGWLLAARPWDDARLSTLAELTESSVVATARDRAPPPLRDPSRSMRLMRSLPDWRGNTLRTLYLQHTSVELAEVMRIDAWEARVFTVFGIGMIVAVGASLHYWILRPLGAISTSLHRGDTVAIRPWLKTRDELGRVAQLIESSVKQRDALQRQIDERKRVEEALLASQHHLQKTLAQRAKLGRDLHDGVIQTLYSAGLGIASAQKILHHKPAQAEATLDLCRRTLNDTIRDVRNFITGLEPEDLARQSLQEIVTSLLASLRSIHPANYRLRLDPAVAEDLLPSHKANLLQIVREGVSNALRHGRPSEIEVSLQRDGSEALLQVEDNGSGFSSQASNRQGRGLRNLEARAIELDGVFELSARPGGGTLLRVRFPIPSVRT